MIAPGDITPRQDSSRELYVAVLSNSIHLAANTGRVITCPFIPGRISDDTMAMVVPINQPDGTLLPELVQWLPSSALGEPIGAVGEAALGEAASIVAALIS
ncbi:toxin [Mycobacterium kansasii]|uniref:Toxin n=1 Tax=Mycobacterium innocens TaxID=2341083 RepID=A0A498Q4Y3_9MYCO|nr:MULTISPECIES: toxin [Mycobacterium]KZS73132.1 toxin [Mycobacterium kansasii]VBA40019.1 Toxin [Mycobacterium innocens]